MHHVLSMQLFDQLKSNSSVTSLDMSQNQLTDESLQVGSLPLSKFDEPFELYFIRISCRRHSPPHSA